MFNDLYVIFMSLSFLIYGIGVWGWGLFGEEGRIGRRGEGFGSRVWVGVVGRWSGGEVEGDFFVFFIIKTV